MQVCILFLLAGISKHEFSSIGISQGSTFRVCHPFPCHPRNAEKAAKFPYDVIEIEDTLPPNELADENFDTQIVDEGLMDTAAGKHAKELDDKVMDRFDEDPGLDETSPYQPPATRFY